MKHFKIVYGYNQDEYLEITEDELPKAIALFMQATGRATFQNGALRGQDIMRIVPDWHKAKGWNKTYKMTTEDHKEVERWENDYRNFYLCAKHIAEYSVKTNAPELLSMPFMEALKLTPENSMQREHSNAVKMLANKM